uniref:USP domain-containing protein n=1 Tax=Arcella intermedia TaxID=1963864 RepID=A0A6B2L2B8_9EUKA
MTKRPLKVSLVVEGEGTISSLMASLSSLVGVPECRIQLCHVDSENLISFNVISSTNTKQLKDTMCAYELIEITNGVVNEVISVRLLNRKVQRKKRYFINPFDIHFFSLPLIASFHKSNMNNTKFYQMVFKMVGWMYKENRMDHDEYPFTLYYVNERGTSSRNISWFSQDIGTPIPIDEGLLDLDQDETVAIDWKPKLNLLQKIGFNYTNWFDIHESVKENYDNLKKPISLDQCFDWFSHNEELSEPIYCSTCKQHEKVWKKLEIWKAPPILIVHLKRFMYFKNRWIKSNRSVLFPQTNLHLQCQDMISPSDSDTNSSDKGTHDLVFDLYACVNHYGTMSGGHYTVYSQNLVDKNWYLYNDHQVSHLEHLEDIQSPAAYILFYKVQGVENSFTFENTPITPQNHDNPNQETEFDPQSYPESTEEPSTSTCLLS